MLCYLYWLNYEKKKLLNNFLLVDLGLAVRTDTKEDWIYVKCGTYGYLAPEVDKAKHKNDYDTKTDIFSAGCILYYLLKG